MALTSCKECGKEISEFAPICPHCGVPNARENEGADQQPKRRSIWKVVLGIPVAVFAMFFIYGIFASQSPKAQEKFSAREHIEACWKEQARKSFDPATARFVAGTCEMLEREFFTKYGHKP